MELLINRDINLNQGDFMKMLRNFTLSVSAIMLFSQLSLANVGLILDKSASVITWEGKKLAGAHTGKVSLENATISLNKKGKLESVEAVVNMDSMTCDDLTGEWNQKLVGHLKSPDFFDVTNHKTSTFKSTKVTSKGKDTYLIKGDLTIKGKTLPAELTAKMNDVGGKITFSGDLQVDRTAYDIKYNSGKFFQNLGDKLIDDKFTLKLSIVANSVVPETPKK